MKKRINIAIILLLLVVESALFGQNQDLQPQMIIDYFQQSPFNLEEKGEVQLRIGDVGATSIGVLLESTDGQVSVVITPSDVLILSGVESHPDIPVTINTIGAALFNLNPTLNSLLLKTRSDEGNFENRFVAGQTIIVPGPVDPFTGVESVDKTVTSAQLRLFDIRLENVVQSVGGLREMGLSVNISDALGKSDVGQ